MTTASTTIDVAIIGAGPAGLQAGIYTARAKLATLVLTSPTKKSQLETVPFIGNYLGFPDGISGKQLLEIGKRHIEKYGGAVKEQEVLKAMSLSDANGERAGFEVKTPTDTYHAKSIIIATGLGIMRAGIRGEVQFENKGVSYCVICDGYFFQHKKVAVIGHKDFAAEKAVELFSYSKDITLFTQGNRLDVSPEMQQEINREHVKIRTEKVVEIKGDNVVKSLVISTGPNMTTEEAFDGVFVGVGTASSLSFAKTLGVETEGNFLKYHAAGTTNVPGVFAAGDCMGAPLQISKAVGEGTVAAIGAIKYLRGSSHVDHGHS